MAWAPKVVAAYAEVLGEPHVVHTALTAGDDLVDVAEFRLEDGSVVYGTAGLSEGGGWSAFEFVLHAAAPHEPLIEMVARIGGSSRQRDYLVGGTVPLSGPPEQPPPFDGVGFLYGGRRLPVGDANFALRQIVGLTAEELVTARRDGLYSIEAAWDLDGTGCLASPGRATSPSLADLTPVRPPSEDIEGLSPDGRAVIEMAIQVDHDGAEGIRGYFGEEDAKILARVMGARLPHPSQLACLLHALMDHSVEEQRTPALRMLQLSPSDHMAGQYYADALAVLAVLDGGDWEEAYFGYEADFEAACKAAERQRNKAGLEVLYGLHPNPFVRPR